MKHFFKTCLLSIVLAIFYLNIINPHMGLRYTNIYFILFMFITVNLINIKKHIANFKNIY